MRGAKRRRGFSLDSGMIIVIFICAMFLVLIFGLLFYVKNDWCDLLFKNFTVIKPLETHIFHHFLRLPRKIFRARHATSRRRIRSCWGEGRGPGGAGGGGQPWHYWAPFGILKSTFNDNINFSVNFIFHPSHSIPKRNINKLSSSGPNSSDIFL